MSEELAATTSDGVLTLAINRPERRNALSRTLLQAMSEGLGASATDPNVRVIVLRGQGELPFSSGYDVEGVGEGKVDEAEARRLQEPVREVARLIAASPKPVIGAAREFVFGAALDVFAHCDLRVSAAGTRFIMAPARLGFSYPAEGLATFINLLGLSRTVELTLLAEPVSDEVMLDWGFLHRRWPGTEFEGKLQELAGMLAQRAPRSLSSLKAVLSSLSPQPSDAAICEGYRLFTSCLNSADAQEGLAAFREKRRPRFRGE